MSTRGKDDAAPKAPEGHEMQPSEHETKVLGRGATEAEFIVSTIESITDRYGTAMLAIEEARAKTAEIEATTNLKIAEIHEQQAIRLAEMNTQTDLKLADLHDRQASRREITVRFLTPLALAGTIAVILCALWKGKLSEAVTALVTLGATYKALSDMLPRGTPPPTRRPAEPSPAELPAPSVPSAPSAEH